MFFSIQKFLSQAFVSNISFFGVLFIFSNNPDSVKLRKRRRLHGRRYVADGSNFVWHLDGHDKLKPFGFSIYGCIDGFS